MLQNFGKHRNGVFLLLFALLDMPRPVVNFEIAYKAGYERLSRLIGL